MDEQDITSIPAPWDRTWWIVSVVGLIVGFTATVTIINYTIRSHPALIELKYIPYTISTYALMGIVGLLFFTTLEVSHRPLLFALTSLLLTAALVAAYIASPVVLLPTGGVSYPTSVANAAYVGGFVFLAAYFAVLTALVLIPPERMRWPKWLGSVMRARAFRPICASLIPLFGIVMAGNVLIYTQQTRPGVFSTGTEPRDAGLLPLWHVLDVAPFVNINATFGWEEPTKHQDFGVGILLLFVKLAVVLGITEFVKAAYKRFTTHD